MSSRSQKLISMSGRLAQRGPGARGALSRAHQASRGAANEAGKREERARKRKTKGPKERYSASFRMFSRGRRGKMAGADDWGRSMKPPKEKPWGGGR